jgi:hypothetical protein
MPPTLRSHLRPKTRGEKKKNDTKRKSSILRIPKCPPNNPQKVLLLGMVHSFESRPSFGQEFRDGVRCRALEQQGFEVYTLDDKHTEDEAIAGKHCKANFADSRRMISSMRSTWGAITFDIIILDYFFCPVSNFLIKDRTSNKLITAISQSGWAKARWTNNFYRDSLPALVKEKILTDGGQVWLPFIKCVEDSLLTCVDYINPYFTYTLVVEPNKNPLFAATESEAVIDQLRKCPKVLENYNQLLYLLDYSKTPFCLLAKRSNIRLSKDNIEATNSLAETPQDRKRKFKDLGIIEDEKSNNETSTSLLKFFDVDDEEFSLRDLRVIKRQTIREQIFV